MINVSNAKKLATWHAIALTSDALTVTTMDMSQPTALVKSHLQAHQQDAGTTTTGRHDRSTSLSHNTPGITTMTIGIGTDSVHLDLTPIIPDIGITFAVNLT